MAMAEASTALSEMVKISQLAVGRCGYQRPMEMTDSETSEMQRLMTYIDAEALGVEPRRFKGLKPGEIRYIDVCNHPSVTMAVFVLGAGSSLPYHDHPGMCVFSKVLWGKLGVDSYDLTGNNGRDAARKKRKIAGKGDTLLLTPTLGNVHAFRAEENEAVAVFDVLLPPYDWDKGRPCTYLREDEDGTTDKERVSLEEIEPPNLFMTSMKYRGVNFTS